MEPSKYIPINCNFYDELEALAVLKKETVIQYYNDQGAALEKTARILDFFIRDKVEYMKLSDATDIRLDYLIAVDGKALPNHC